MTFIAARTSPDPSRTGAATERTPGASSSSARAHPWARTRVSSRCRSFSDRSGAGGSPDRDGSATTPATSDSGRAASSTFPCDVRSAGNRVPMSTRSAMIFGTATRAT